MIFLISTIMAAGFTIVWVYAGVNRYIREIFDLSYDAFKTVTDADLEDIQKERKLRTLSGQLAKHAVIVVGISIMALALPVILVWLMSRTGLFSLSLVVESFYTFKFWGGTLIIGFFIYYLL